MRITNHNCEPSEWPPTPRDEGPCFDMIVDTDKAAKKELGRALDGDGDRILEALNLLNLNAATIELIANNAENFCDEKAALYGVEGLYEKLTGKSMGIKEMF